MKEQTYFHIPTPCHENWENMTPEDRGRHCTSCNKQVIDFTLMSDQQVLNYFKNATGKVCGRFADDQLQRPMGEAQQQKKKIWWVVAMTPLLLLFGKANAQKKNKTPQLSFSLTARDTNHVLLGKISSEIRAAADTEQVIRTDNCFKTVVDTIISTVTNDLIVRGTLTDSETGEALPFASVQVKNSNTGAACDANGNFNITLKNHTTLPTLKLSYVGYESKEIDFNKQHQGFLTTYIDGSKEIIINFELTRMQTAVMGDIVTVGLLVTCKKPRRIDTLKTVANKIVRKEAFKILPNPVKSGSSVQLAIKKAGEYSLQVLSNNASLILVKNFSSPSDYSMMDITIPSNVVPGIYYVCLIDEKKKKQYTDKLVVQ